MIGSFTIINGLFFYSLSLAQSCFLMAWVLIFILWRLEISDAGPDAASANRYKYVVIITGLLNFIVLLYRVALFIYRAAI